MQLEPGFWQQQSEFLDWVSGMQAAGTFDDETADLGCVDQTSDDAETIKLEGVPETWSRTGLIGHETVVPVTANEKQAALRALARNFLVCNGGNCTGGRDWTSCGVGYNIKYPQCGVCEDGWLQEGNAQSGPSLCLEFLNPLFPVAGTVSVCVDLCVVRVLVPYDASSHIIALICIC